MVRVSGDMPEVPARVRKIDCLSKRLRNGSLGHIVKGSEAGAKISEKE